jgi:hypothetical protein
MNDDLTPPRNFALVAACFEGGLAVLAVGLGWLLGRAPLQTLHWTWPDAGWGAAAVLPPLGILWLCVKCPWRPLAEIIRVIDEVLVPLFENCRLSEFAVIAALAGLGEELLFRGVIQTAVAEWVGGNLGVWVGLAAAGLLFGLGHAVTFTYVLLAGLIGLYLGGIWLATGNLLVPMLAHAGYDFLALVYLVNIRKKSKQPK